MPQVARAVTAGLLWTGVSAGLLYFSGAGIDLMSVATEGGLMGVSSLGADALHEQLKMDPTSLSSAAVTGAMFAGFMKLVRGSNAYVVNAIGGAGVDLVTDKLVAMKSAPPSA